MTQILYVDRSRVQSYLRCRRQRWWEYESGPAGVGIVPVRKGIHLVIGLAFHAGAELLLREASRCVAAWSVEEFFAQTDPDGVHTSRQVIEDAAVQAALAELALHTVAGVDLDVVEQPEPGKDQAAAKPVADANAGSADSPIVLDFGSLGEFTVGGSGFNFADPIYPADSAPASEEDAQLAAIEISTQANAQAATGMDDYLKLELAALVEAMVRVYARRRLRPLLAEFEVLEVEREGAWKLGEISLGPVCVDEYGAPNEHHMFDVVADGSLAGNYTCLYCGVGKEEAGPTELHWMSRHDALLLERSTNFLYLLSFKTTGQWDRRKKQDAEIDMQGLSEAVDVEKRLGEAWLFLGNMRDIEASLKDGSAQNPKYSQERWHNAADRVMERVSPRIAEWLRTQPSPPKILGVRYEYILKGARRQDKKDATSPGRYVQDTPLIRAYRSDGITAEDRRWAPRYEWHDAAGKERRIDYRTWKKSAVWETMPIARWIDLLDAGETWPGPDGYDADGAPQDVLADQFVPPVTVYRSEDDMRDWLEQVEAQEVRVALDVAEVRRAQAEGEGAYRSALNRLFPQTRAACSWPGPCSFLPVCFGGQDIRRDPLTNSELFQIRPANHPIEMEVPQ